MLFLHGYGSKKESFYYQTKFLSQFYRVTAPDFPCFGASEPAEEAWGVSEYAAWLENFIAAARLNRPHIIAHSFGARVAIKFLSTRGALADKLIITGGAGLVKPRSPAYMRKVRAYRRVKKLFPKFAEKHYGSKEYKSLSPLMRESYKKIVNEDLRECAAKIKNPALFVYGKSDTVTPPEEEGAIFNSFITGSRLELIEGGHFCFSENPEIFNHKILTFLSER